MTDEINTTMPSGLDAELKARFELLPADLQKIILDSNYTTSLFNIAKANKLTYEQLETLQLETLMAFLGMNKPDEYREFLKNSFKKSDTEIDVIIQAVNEQVFDPVKDSLHKLYSSNETQQEEGDADEEDEDETPAQAIPINIAVAPKVVSTPPVAPAQSIPSPEVQPEIKMQPIIQKPAIATVITPQEKTILGSTGIVLGEMQNTVGETSTISSRNDILQGIENPTKTPSATIVANKLSTSATLMPNKTTDYSLPRTTPQSSTPVTPAPPTPVQQSGDQYREKI